MAIDVSAKWDEIIVSEPHWFETRVIINNVVYQQSQIMDLRIEFRAFSEEQPTVGSCLSAELTLKMLKPSATIPRMALIRPQVRVCNGTGAAHQSEWIPQGYFYIDTREESKNDDDLPVISFHCYDTMLKSEAMYPSTESAWPKTDIAVVKEIAYYLGLQTSRTGTAGVDARTIALMTSGYQISAPAGYTMRETLANIASMYAGNWVVSMENKLLLIPINGIPEETSLLVDESGNIIIWGDDPDTGEELAISIVGTE